MSTASDVRAAIALLELRNRDAVRLGELVSLAARIELGLLRAARLELTPFDAAAEADLWFSQLVETRTADWIALAPAAARELRSALAADKSRLGAAHSLLTEAHSGAPATIILEEEILWLALTAPHDAPQAIEARLRMVLGKLLEDTSANRGLAHWFAGASRRLPEEAQATEAYALLSFVTSALLDGRRLNAPEPRQVRLDTLAGVLPDSIPRLRLWATLTDYGLTLRPDRSRGSVPLEVPRTDPLLFEIHPLGESPQFIMLKRGETRTVPIRSGVVELLTAAGDVYRLRHRPRELSSAGMQGLILGFGGTGAHALTALKELSVLKHGRVPENMKFMLFDTIADWRPGKTVQLDGRGSEEQLALSEVDVASLDPNTEYFYLRDYDPDLRTYVYNLLSPTGDPERYPHMKDWLHAPWFSQNFPPRQLNVTEGAVQQRQIGRYVMFKNAEHFVACLRSIISRLSQQAKGSALNVWLVASAAGGTGAGCLLDAAYLTRLAADNIDINLNGVVVLPNVHMGVPGVSRARAYSLLRELERVQGQGISPSDLYEDLHSHSVVSSQVAYDGKEQQVATVSHRLFDGLFYLGRDCPTEEHRRQFFNAAATAMEPYFDAYSSPALLQRAVNTDALASSFSAARVWLPIETFKEIFAWEQVAEYFRRAAAADENNGRVERLHAGSPVDNEYNAVAKFRSLLVLFNELLNLVEESNGRTENFARNALEPERIVTDWYELSRRAPTSEEQTVLLTYANPFYSLNEPWRPRDLNEWELKTYKENAAAGGLKERQEESRDRFADSLEEIMRRYLNRDGGERTFGKGRRHVFKTVSEHLRRKVDDLFIGELELRRAEFAQSPDKPSEGTALTRLFAELTWMLRKQGPLGKLQEVVGQLITAVAREQPERDNQVTWAIRELRASKRAGYLLFNTWVEQYQQMARVECSGYIRWYQKHELLKDMQQLVLGVEHRLREWEHLLSQLFGELVRREGRDENEASALYAATHLHLRNRLEVRLNRAARDRNALISFGPQPDPQMHGYQDELRRQAASGLAADLLAVSHWEAGVAADGSPNIALVIESPDLKENSYSARDIRRLSQGLYQLFHRRVNERLSTTDIFDYLIWLREHNVIWLEEVANALDAEAAPPINAGGAPDTSILIYKLPYDPKKREMVALIQKELIERNALVSDPEQSHTDQNSLTLLKIKRLRPNQFAEVEDCRKDYINLNAAALNGNEAHDMNLYRAQVFHPFRQELEAWYIERSNLKETMTASAQMLPPRIVRLLEDPLMMQLFAQSVATGAVEMVEGRGWLWHGPDEDIELTVLDDDPAADIIQAAVTFTLKKGGGRGGSFRTISPDAARQSVVRSAQSKDKTLDVMLVEFVKRRLDAFLTQHAPEAMRAPLKMVFTFYCDPRTRTGLQHRLDL